MSRHTPLYTLGEISQEAQIIERRHIAAVRIYGRTTGIIFSLQLLACARLYTSCFFGHGLLSGLVFLCTCTYVYGLRDKRRDQLAKHGHFAIHNTTYSSRFIVVDFPDILSRKLSDLFIVYPLHHNCYLLVCTVQ